MATKKAAAHTESVKIKNRWTGEVQFTAKITCSPDALPSIKLGLAVRAALKAGANLVGADLAGADLAGADLAGAYLVGADLADADLVGADLANANLARADLARANLANANLAGADLVECPVKIPNIHQAIYKAASQPNALDMHVWHTCGTTHCRAGWVVTLAGEGGKALEYALGTNAAAALIYKASDPTLERIPDWFAGNEDALADMKALAEVEASK